MHGKYSYITIVHSPKFSVIVEWLLRYSCKLAYTCDFDSEVKSSATIPQGLIPHNMPELMTKIGALQ